MSRFVAPVLLTALVGGLAQANTITATCDSSKRTQTKIVKVSVGQTLEVVASGNPTAGYNWISEEKINVTYTPDNDSMTGSDGAFVFKIKVTQGVLGMTLTFKYARPWDPSSLVSICKVKLTEQ